MKPKANWKDCPGMVDPVEHTMRDYCWSCAPFWERFAVCPKDGSRLHASGYCRKCKRYYDVKETKC